MAHDVFISYSSEDKTTADILSGIKPGGRIFPLITFEPRGLPIALRMREATVYDKADPEPRCTT